VRDRDPLRHLEADLAELESAGLLRVAPSRDGVAALEVQGAPLVLCSNDYLGYAAEPWPADVERAPAGAGASRLVSGEHPEHGAAEGAIAEWLGAESALLFSSGYAANVGTIASLAGAGDLVVSDALNHASIIDGCRLSGAEVRVVGHLDAAAIEEVLSRARGHRRRWVVTESYFSMDGDSPDLARLRAACLEHDAALVVDEAHALGVFGPRGAGRCAELGVRPDVLIGTLGKALGLQGAFVCGPATVRSWLWNRARSFVFSTGISPALARAAEGRVRRVAADDAGRRRLRAAGDALRLGLAQQGIGVSSTEGPVLPILVGEARAAMALSERLRASGVKVQAIRPPTVPVNAARLRLTASASLSRVDVDRALDAFRRAWGVG
jgi:8-amino-7-oxononanoate synthase